MELKLKGKLKMDTNLAVLIVPFMELKLAHHADALADKQS